jgi:hypothetical protein
MRLDYLLQRYLEEVARERTNVRRVALYLLPLVALPLGALLTWLLMGWRGLVGGGLGALVLMAQVDFFVRPVLRRLDLLEGDAPLYVALPQPALAPPLLSHLRLLVPGALCLFGSVALFATALPGERTTPLYLTVAALSLAVLIAVWQPIDLVLRRTADLQRRIREALDALGAPHQLALSERDAFVRTREGALDPQLLARLAPFEREITTDLTLSPAAQALVRTELYLLLRDYGDADDATIRRAAAELAEQARAEERAARALPPVGGKIYLPCAARGTLGITLGATMRRLGLDGTFSGVLGTWLVRLPPARSHAVAARLIDALAALGLLPRGSVLPFHLTLQGALGQQARLLSLLHLASVPLVLEERGGHAEGDDRPFIMQGTWIIDSLTGGRRSSGARTDFVDGFVLVEAPAFGEIEHLLGHGVNLRIKQVLAWPVLAAQRPRAQWSRAEREALLRFWQFEREFAALLERYDLADGLRIAWLDGNWRELGPYLARLNAVKQREPDFVAAAQALRDAALDDLAAIAAR